MNKKLKKHLQITSLEPKIKRFKRILYNHGIRYWNCIHARLRIGCSGLNDHLYSNLHVIDTPNCSCGASSETVFHYFFQCDRFEDEREQLFQNISLFTKINISIIIYGETNLSLEDNFKRFDR